MSYCVMVEDGKGLTSLESSTTEHARCKYIVTAGATLTGIAAPLLWYGPRSQRATPGRIL